MACLEVSEFSRSMNIRPHNQAASPNGQAYNNSFLATIVHFRIIGTNSMRPIKITVKQQELVQTFKTFVVLLTNRPSLVIVSVSVTFGLWTFCTVLNMGIVLKSHNIIAKFW